MDKIHFTYKTSSPSGKYYVGRHTTTNINDGYLGSGTWIRGIKDKSNLTREILQTYLNFEELRTAEKQLLQENVGKENCMNFNNEPVGFGSGEFSNWHSSVESRERAFAARKKRGNKGMPTGEDHWTYNNNEFKQIASKRFTENNPSQDPVTMAKIAAKTSERMKINNPMFDPVLCKKISETGKFALDNPSKIEYSCPHCNRTGKGGRFKSHHITNKKCIGENNVGH